MGLKQSPDAPILKASWQMGLANPTPGIKMYKANCMVWCGFKKTTIYNLIFNYYLGFRQGFPALCLLLDSATVDSFQVLHSKLKIIKSKL